MRANGMWRTPQAHNANQGPNESMITLTDQARHNPGNWPTPKTPTGGGQMERKTAGGGIRKLEDAISREVGYNTGQLNPAWVEILQGFPQGWTDIGPQAQAPSNTNGSRRA